MLVRIHAASNIAAPSRKAEGANLNAAECIATADHSTAHYSAFTDILAANGRDAVAPGVCALQRVFISTSMHLLNFA